MPILSGNTGYPGANANHLALDSNGQLISVDPVTGARIGITGGNTTGYPGAEANHLAQLGITPTGGALPGLGGTVGQHAVVPKAGKNQFAGSNLQYVASVPTQRKLLSQAGYSVATTGGTTERLKAAWADYFKTRGLGGASWNISPQPLNVGGSGNAAALAATVGGGRTNKKTTAANPGLAGQVPGMGPVQTLDDPTSPNFANLYANVNAPTNPITGSLTQYAKNYANNAANTQYNPILAALNQQINRQGADTNAAMQGIAALYKPVLDQAQDNVSTAADPANAGAAAVGSIGTSVGQAFGLGADTPGDLGAAITKNSQNDVAALQAQGANATTGAKALQQIAAQGQTDNQNDWRQTEQSNINDLKDQLVQQQVAKNAAKVSGIDTGLQQGSTLENNYLSQLDQIATGKEQAAFADQQYVGNQLSQQGTKLDNTGKTIANQGATYQNTTAPLVLRDQLLGDAATRVNASKQLALQSKEFLQTQKNQNVTNQLNIAKAAQAQGGWGNYLNNPKNALDFAGKIRTLLVDSKTGQPIAGLTPSSAYNTVAHTMASAGFPSNTPQGQQMLVQALQGAGFDLTGYQLGPQGLVLAPQQTQHPLSKGDSGHTFTKQQLAAMAAKNKGQVVHGKGY